ncbi:pinin [Aphis craccivora]|uniref:Pinin n=1 Tax=Aphis craccivora TaxID=307492 RepID=A0A6G0YLQ0_APHCR|nr:pinin [Aphis craccivora]
MTTLLDRLREHLLKKRQGLSDVHETLKKITGRDIFDDHLSHGKFNKRSQVGGDQKPQFRESIKKDVKRLRDNNKPSFRNDNQNRKVYVNPNETSKVFKNGNNTGRISAKDHLRTIIADDHEKPIKEKFENDDDMDEDSICKKTLQSQVILSFKTMKSRTEVLAAQQGDQVTKERNRRMFGSLLGTLQKFKKEETQLKYKEEIKAKIERRLEEEAFKEKESLVRLRELFMQKKQQQRDINNIGIKMGLVRKFEIFERQINCAMNFIKTEFDPSVFYLPKIHNEKTEKKLSKTRSYLSSILEKNRNMVESQVEKLLQPHDEQMEFDDRVEDEEIRVADEKDDADVDVNERHQDNGTFNYDQY